MIEAVADRLGGQALARQDGEPLLEPGLQRHDQGLGVRLPAGPPLISRATAQAALDGIELGDALQRFLGRRGRTPPFEVNETAPQVRPAEGQRDAIRAVLLFGRIDQCLVGGIAVALYDAGIAFK